VVLFSILVVRLFQLQILEVDEHQNDYIQMTLSTIATEAVRGNIYDCNGVLLAYDELVYSVTLKDTGYYEKNAQKNQMIWELIQLLDACDEKVEVSIPIGLNENDSKSSYSYTTTSETRIKQFLRDIYGCSLSDLDREDGKYPSDITADEAVEIMKQNYRFDTWKDDDGELITPNAYDTLRIVATRYRLAQNLYKKYISITVASDVKETTMATVKEYSNELQGVDVEEDYIRVYPDGEYFAQIIGYTGLANADELSALQEIDPSYESGDTIGKSGIESLMEQQLSGTKGSRTMYLDSTGKVLEVISEEEAVVGNDVYLTIDHDLTIACYKLLEQEMASIILTYLTEEDVDDRVLATDGIRISIKEVYNQLFNNSVISISALYDADAPEWEQEIAKRIDSVRSQALEVIEQELKSTSPHAIEELDEDLQDYMQYAFTYLCSTSGYLNTGTLDKTTDSYKSVANGTGNLRDFLFGEIAKGDVVNLAALTTDTAYYESDWVYEMLIDALLTDLQEDTGFTKIFIEHLIDENRIEPWLICETLYSQGIIDYDSDKAEALKQADSTACYRFMADCISNLLITPAQLALDPCNGSVIITDVNTGEIRALVSYPSYDNNMFSGTVDATYYSSLLADQSNPLFNYATQARSAPGSTFKMLSSIAALEEGIVSADTEFDCTGIFDLVLPAAKCWIYTEENKGHGPLNVVGALANSCNFYFYNVGYELSLEDDGTYNEQLGIDKLASYAALLGLNEKSGVELNEYAPQISTEYPVTSAIGQGTNNYTPIQLARYVTAIANKGTLFDLTLLQQVEDHDGNVVDTCQNASRTIEGISDSTWEAVHEGMYEVTHSGTVAGYYSTVDFDISGKTGSAQEDLYRPNHALFVSFGPSEDPEITVTCTIRNGYSSGYSASLARDIYKYYFGKLTLEDIMGTRIIENDGSTVGD
jgi:penicillin-binding protein 2